MFYILKSTYLYVVIFYFLFFNNYFYEISFTVKLALLELCRFGLAGQYLPFERVDFKEYFKIKNLILNFLSIFWFPNTLNLISIC